MPMGQNTRAVIQNYAGPKYQEWANKPEVLALWELSLVRQFCPDPQAAILNVGCGAGRETFALYDLGYRNVRGIDPTEALLNVAAQLAQDRGLGIEFSVGTVDALPYPDQSFEVLTLFENVLGHITPRWARISALKEMNRVLKPGGLILLDVTSLSDRWLAWGYIRALELLRVLHNPAHMDRGDKAMRDARQTPGVSYANRPRSHWFRPGDVPQEARQAGLTVMLSSTRTAVVRDPSRNSRKRRGQGRFVYVLRKEGD